MNDKEVKRLLGLKIKFYRNKLGMSQDKLGEEVGITQRQISLIELGHSFPKPITLVNLCTIFKCSTKDLFDFEIIKPIKNIRHELNNVINNLSDDKLKILYLIGKNL